MIFGGVFREVPETARRVRARRRRISFTIGRVDQAFHVRPDVVEAENSPSPRRYLGA